MSNIVKFKINGLSGALNNVYTRVTDLSRVGLFEGETLVSDAAGNVELGIGEAGADGQGVIVYGDNYEVGSESTFKSFSGYGVISTFVDAPLFISQPQMQAVDEYSTATFTASASNFDSLQFYNNGVAVGAPVTSSPIGYQITTSANDNGDVITCVATKGAESVTSNAANLTVNSYLYDFNGTSNYLDLNTDIIVPASSDFEIIVDSEFKYNTFYIASDYPALTTRLMILSNGAFYVNNTQVFKLTTPAFDFLLNGNKHKLSVKRVGTTWTVAIDTDRFVQSGTVATAAVLTFTSLFRAWGTAPSTLWLKGRLSEVTCKVGGATVLSTKVNNKPAGAAQSGVTIMDYNVASWFSIPNPLARDYDNIVFVGASIVEQTFGRNLLDDNITLTNYFNLYGVKVYGYGWSGYELDNGSDKLAEAIAHFAGTRTLYIAHLGGNDVSGTRPYATMNASGVQQITNGFNKLYTAISSVLNDTMVADLTFRDYDGTTFANQENGSLPYVLNEQSPRRLAKFTNTDGRSVMDWYNFTLQNRVAFLSDDNIHPTEGGKVMLREFSLDRLRYAVTGGSIPAPL